MKVRAFVFVRRSDPLGITSLGLDRYRIVISTIRRLCGVYKPLLKHRFRPHPLKFKDCSRVLLDLQATTDKRYRSVIDVEEFQQPLLRCRHRLPCCVDQISIVPIRLWLDAARRRFLVLPWAGSIAPLCRAYASTTIAANAPPCSLGPVV